MEETFGQHKHTDRHAAYQNTNDFLWFLVIHRDSIDLLQFIPDVNQSYHAEIAKFICLQSF